MSDARSRLTPSQARTFLGLVADLSVPEEEALLADARAIVLRTLRLDAELASLSTQGLQLSPVWEPRGDVVQVRLVVAPPAHRARYFAGEEAEDALSSDDFLRLIAQVAPFLIDDPVGASVALEDTHRFWSDPDGPTRTIGVSYRGHEKILSLLIADAVRKATAEFSTLAWLSSLGLPVEEFREPEDPSPEAIAIEARERFAAMKATERAWSEKAFGR